MISKRSSGTDKVAVAKKVAAKKTVAAKKVANKKADPSKKAVRSHAGTYVDPNKPWPNPKKVT